MPRFAAEGIKNDVASHEAASAQFKYSLSLANSQSFRPQSPTIPISLSDRTPKIPQVLSGWERRYGKFSLMKNARRGRCKYLHVSARTQPTPPQPYVETGPLLNDWKRKASEPCFTNTVHFGVFLCGRVSLAIFHYFTPVEHDTVRPWVGMPAIWEMLFIAPFNHILDAVRVSFWHVLVICIITHSAITHKSCRPGPCANSLQHVPICTDRKE